MIATVDSKSVQNAVTANISRRLSGVKRKILILSGKGGVGKSTVASQLGMDIRREGEAQREGKRNNSRSDDEKERKKRMS